MFSFREKPYLQKLAFTLYLISVLEILGFFGLVTLRLSGQEISHGLRWTLPHPIFCNVPAYCYGPGDRNEKDPNLVWQTAGFSDLNFPPPPRKAGEFRIFIFGGSTVEGHGAGIAENTIAHQLEKALQGKIGDRCVVHVYNKGSSGYASKQQLLQLALKVAPFEQPDLVLFLDGVNDFLVPAMLKADLSPPPVGLYLYDEFWHRHERAHMKGIESVQTLSGALGQSLKVLIGQFLGRTFTGVFLDNFYRVVISPKKTLTLYQAIVGATTFRWTAVENIDTRFSDYYMKNIAAAEGIAQSTGAQFLWALQPVLFHKKTPSDFEREILEDPYFGVTFWKAFSNFYNAVRPHATGKSRLDMSRFFSNSTAQDFVDHVHYSPEGQRKIGAALAETLLPRLAREASSPCNLAGPR
jgi:lysophospholipase L1-like esterase